LANNLNKIKSSLNDINEDLVKLYELQKDSIGPINTIKKLEVQKKIQESNYSSALYNRQKSVILAPFDGFIGYRLKKSGEFTQPAAPVVQYFSHDKNASFYVPEEIVTSLKLEQEVVLKLKQNIVIQTKITAIGLSPSTNGLYKIKTDIINKENIKDGFTVTSIIYLNTFEENCILPLRFVDKITSKKTIIAYVLKDEKAQKITIPFKKSYDDGFIISSAYIQYDFIEIFRALEEGIIIRNK